MVTARARPDSLETPTTSNNDVDIKLANFIYPQLLFPLIYPHWFSLLTCSQTEATAFRHHLKLYEGPEGNDEPAPHHLQTVGY
eukprot:16451568-Heterocapsa_arctica.AAC.1